jgi:hypothetical protein
MSAHTIRNHGNTEFWKQGQAILVPGPGLPDIGQSYHKWNDGHGQEAKQLAQDNLGSCRVEIIRAGPQPAENTT